MYGHEEKADTVDPYTTKSYFIVLSQVNKYTLTVNLFLLTLNTFQGYSSDLLTVNNNY